ncbi:MAG: glycosyltransferase family 1 protein [bacterium]|nr:glycosyltransferase family 1 protein [bacterium]
MRIVFGVYYSMGDNASSGIYTALRAAGHEVSVFPRLAEQDAGRVAGEDTGAYVLESLSRRVALLDANVLLARSLSAFFPTVRDLHEFRARHPGVKLVDLSQYHPYSLYESFVGDMSAVAKTGDYDMLLCQCHNSIAHLAGYNAHAVYYPSFATPLLYDRIPGAERSRLACDVLMPWNSDYDTDQFPTDICRKSLVNECLDGGVTNIRIYGGDAEPTRNLWLQADPEFSPYVRPAADVRLIARVMASAKIVLSSSVISANSVVAPLGYWSDRVPCAMLAGSLVLSDNRESVTAPWTVGGETRQLVDGEHLVLYDTEAEAVDKARYYLDNPKERQRIAQAGYEFAHAHLVEDEIVPGIILPAIEALF